MWNLPCKRICVFDLETTEPTLASIRGSFPDIVEVGACILNRDLEVEDTYQTLVQPPNLHEYTEFSESLTGIPYADVAAAPLWKDVWREFAEFTKFNGITLASFGVAFDLSALKQAYWKNNLGYPHSIHALDIPTMMYTSAAYWGYKMKWSLRGVAEKLEIPATGTSHRALDDAILGAKIIATLAVFGDDQ